MVPKYYSGNSTLRVAVRSAAVSSPAGGIAGFGAVS